MCDLYNKRIVYQMTMNLTTLQNTATEVKRLFFQCLQSFFNENYDLNFSLTPENIFLLQLTELNFVSF